MSKEEGESSISKQWLLIIICMVLVLAAMPLLTACGGDDDDSGSTLGTTSEEVVEKEFRIGLLTTLFGSPDEMDQSIFMAADEINEAGGIQVGSTVYKLKISWADDKQTAEGAVLGIQQLLYDDRVDLLDIATYAGGQVAQPYADESKKIALYRDTGDLVLGPDHPYAFRTHFDIRLNNMIVLDWVRQNHPDLKKIEIIQLNMTQYLDLAPIEKKVGGAWGLDVHYIWYDFNTKDFNPVMYAALRSDPEAIVVTHSGGTAIMKQAREMGFEGQFILSEMLPSSWYDVVSPDELEGLISMSPVDDSPEVPQAYKDYRLRYKELHVDDTYSSFSTYMTPYLVAAVIKAAGGTDPDKMKEVMETQPLNLEFPESATMTIQFSGEQYYGVDHNWQPNQYIAVTENGKLVQERTLTLEEQLQYLDLILNPPKPPKSPKPSPTLPPPPRQLTIDDTIRVLMDHPETRAILEKHIPEIVSDPRLPLTFTLRSLFSMAGDLIDQSKLPLIEADMSQLPPLVVNEYCIPD